MAFLALFLLTTAAVSYTVSAPARGKTPWDALAACAATTVLGLAATMYMASRKGYR